MNRHLLVTALAFQFSLNVIWENLQGDLYVGHAALWHGGRVNIIGPIGDTLFAAIAYSVVALVKRNWAWLRTATPRDFVAVGFFGFIWGWVSELIAQRFDLWQYQPGVATVLGSASGPLVELAITTPLAFALARWFATRRHPRC